MTLAFVVNQIATEGPKYTTTLLALRLHQRGHQVLYFSVGDLSYVKDGRVGGLGHSVPDGEYEDVDAYNEAFHANVANARPGAYR